MRPALAETRLLTATPGAPQEIVGRKLLFAGAAGGCGIPTQTALCLPPLQVGSKAGYYTSKSPQLHLQEWVQREKRPRMRVQPRKLDNGKWTCKVRAFGRAPCAGEPAMKPQRMITV